MEFVADDVGSELRFWETSLIMYALGKDLSMNVVKQYVTKFWNDVRHPDMFYHEDGYFLLKFHSLDDRDQVFRNGPYTIHGVPMILKEWNKYFDFKRDMMRTLPVWVKLPNLPLYLWNPKSLGKIGSVLGSPVCTDECTSQKFRVSYARILVEVDITTKVQESIKIRDDEGQVITQPIEREWT